MQDQRNIFTSSILYELPFGRGQEFYGNISYPLNLFVGGWQLSVISHIASGSPLDLSVSGNADADTPDRVGPVHYPKSITGTWFDTASFAAPPTATANGNNVFTRIGTLGSNQIYGPGQRSADVSLQKNIEFVEGYVLELRGDAFNITNSPQFTNPDGGIYDANFGKVTGTELDSQREVQLAARFTF